MKQIAKILGLLLLFGIVASAYADPLYVSYTEKFNVSADVSGDGSTTYAINNLTGYITINNTATSVDDTLSDVWVAVNISNNISGLTLVHNGAPKGVFLKDSAPAYTGLPAGLTYIHIPVLSNSNYVQYKFEINTSITGVPILVDEAYSTTKVPARKLSNWTVSMNISRNISSLPSTNSVVNVRMTKYLSNDSNNYGDSTWNFLNITGASSDQGSTAIWDSPYATITTTDAINWTGVVLNSTQNGTIEFNVSANNTHQDRNSTEKKYGFAVIFFDYNGTISNTTIDGVYAAGNGVISATKNGPYKNETTGKYTLWYENATFNNSAKQYYFNLTKTNLWAVNGSNPTTLDPFDSSLLIGGSSHVFPLNINIAPGDAWNSDTFNFTFDRVPVVWANCTFTVADSNITLLNRTVHEYDSEYGSSYIVVEEIYVVGSYLIKVTKHIIPNADGTYDVYIVVENIGSQESPFVYAYDLIPQNFVVSDMSVNKSSMLNNSGNHSISNPDYNMSIYWALNPLSPNADGDGNYTDATEINDGSTVVIHYNLNGTGEFKPTDAFIVGIDPTHSLLPTTSPKMVLVSGAVSNNFEPLLALFGALLSVGIILRIRIK